MSVKAVALVLVTVGGVGAVLALNPVDAKHAAAHSAKQTAQPAGVLRPALPSQEFPPPHPQGRGPAKFGHRPPSHPLSEGSAISGQTVTVNHDLSQQWSDDTGWDGEWDDDVPRPPHRIHPSGHDGGPGGRPEVDGDGSGNDNENSDISGREQ